MTVEPKPARAGVADPRPAEGHPTPFTERMNKLIAWAEERAEQASEKARQDEARGWPGEVMRGRASAFREVANHLRQLRDAE